MTVVLWLRIFPENKEKDHYCIHFEVFSVTSTDGLGPNHHTVGRFRNMCPRSRSKLREKNISEKNQKWVIFLLHQLLC